MPAPFVTVTGLRKSFDGTPALQGVSFEVEAGTTVSLLGPSGCGKTTVLRSIAGLETPDSGRIGIGEGCVFDAERRINAAPENRSIGMVFQSYAVWPHMTVGENVGFPLRIRGVPRDQIKARVTDVLELVGLAGLGTRAATNLSGGQQQRVALARAIVHQPPLVLFDEPLSNLDAQLRDQMRAELRLLQSRLGFTAIYVTHDQHEALGLSDKVVVMRHGRIEGIGSPRDLFKHPTTPFVASFLGFDNMLEGTIVAVDPSGTTEGGSGLSVRVALPGGVTLAGAWRGRAGAARGARALVAFRSEHVRLAPADGLEPAGQHGSPWRVDACVYLGTHLDYLVTMGSLTIRASGPDTGLLGPGDRVSVIAAPADCLVFPSSGDGRTDPAPGEES